MKTKKINRKLILNKHTISNLKDDEMNKLNGGVATGLTVCRTICITNCRPCTIVSWCYQCITDEVSACYAC